MIKFDLQPNEGIILQNEIVSRELPKGHNTGDLVLTNQNLYYVTEKGTFKKNLDIAVFPLNQIKVVNGHAQVLLGGSNSRPTLQVLLKDSNEEFWFGNFSLPFQAKKEITNWVNAIYQLLGTEASQTADKNLKVIPGTKGLAETIKGTVGTFKETMGVKGVSDTSITCKCIGCMAPLSGKKGQKVRCKYCDTEQIL